MAVSSYNDTTLVELPIELTDTDYYINAISTSSVNAQGYAAAYSIVYSGITTNSFRIFLSTANNKDTKMTVIGRWK